MPEVYTPQTWANGSGGGTPISAARLQHIEDGIEALDDAVATGGGGGGGGSSVFNVKAYGAVGDGSNDDTAEIQAAIDAAEATITDLAGVVGDGDFAGGGVVYLPPGRYKISAPLTIEKSNIILAGDGPASRIVWSGTGNRMVKVQSSPSPESLWLRRVVIRDLMLDGAGLATSGISFYYAIENLAENVYVYRCNDGPGIELIEMAFCTTIRKCAIRRNGTGIKLGHQSNNIVIADCRIQHNNSHGVVTADGSFDLRGVHLHGNDIEGNGGKGIYFGTGRHRAWFIVGNYFEVNDINTATIVDRRDILIPATTTAADGIYINGNHFAALSTYRHAVEIAAGQNIECFNSAEGYGAAGVNLVLVASGLKRIRYSQTLNGSDAAAEELVGESNPNGFSAARRYKTPAVDVVVGAGRPFVNTDGFSIYDLLAPDTGGAGAHLIMWASTTTNDETTGFAIVKVAGAWSYRRITLGAADSGGSGFKLLRVTNT
jgi:hypothetical protein